MNRPFIPFGVPLVGEEEKREILDVLESGWLTTGSRARRFEELFREYVGDKHAIAVGSCTAALHLSLLACGVGAGDEAITTTFTFAATGNTVVHCGAKPILVDIDPETFNIDPDAVERAITPRTKAIVVVHYSGHPCEMDRLLAIAGKRGIPVIEDAAHAIGSLYKGRKVGSLGRTGCFSFYPTKTITTGEGGMITTSDDGVAKTCRLLSLHGISKDSWERYSPGADWYYEIRCAGYKYNMSDLQAALGIHQLKKIESFIAVREGYARMYDDALRDIPWIRTPVVRDGIRHSRHLYPILLEDPPPGMDRDAVIVRLRERGIGASVHFIPLHSHPFYRDSFGYTPDGFPVAEKVFRSIVSLPLYPRLTVDDVGYIIDTIREFAK